AHPLARNLRAAHRGRATLAARGVQHRYSFGGKTMQDGRLKAALKQARDVAETVTVRVTGVPPRRIRKGISPLWFDFTRTGRDQLEFFTELAGLRPTDRVLDIGCGVGRIAIPLTGYLS